MALRIEYNEETKKFEVIRTKVDSYDNFMLAIESVDNLEAIDFKNIDRNFENDFQVLKIMFPDKLAIDLTKEAYKIAAKLLREQDIKQATISQKTEEDLAEDREWDNCIMALQFEQEDWSN